ncbi:MAG: hypothetical protein IJA30_05615 [Bacilli bacterium]|nr:hypothetical protein [Bacilli bacterium]
MKKIIILVFAVILTIITYNFYETKNIKNENINNEPEYRIEENTIIEESSQETIDQEENIETYVEEINNEVTEITAKEVLTEDDKITLKNTFITLTDFIFYDGKIKGKTFNELTTTAKQKVISIYETIDSKIEEKFPGYKETIKETTTKTYTNLKEQLSDIKDNLLTSYREEVGEENYNDQNKLLDESINTMKDSFSPVIDTIVDKSKEIYETTKEKADTWYKNWKEENAQ